MRTSAKLEREVADIGDLPRQELVAAWTAAHGCPPPKGVKRPLLELSAAWYLQAKRLGGLTASTKRLLRQHGLPRAGAAGSLPSESKETSRTAAATRPPAALASGTRLMREWNGRMYVVDVADDGFIFDGKSYRSLTAIARRITGVHWSGPRFFGL